MARSQWIEPGDPPWLRDDCEMPKNPQLLQTLPSRCTDYESESQEPEPEPEIVEMPSSWREMVLPPAAVVLFAAPHACFQAASGNRYQASEQGEILVTDSDDRTDLLRAGCRAER